MIIGKNGGHLKPGSAVVLFWVPCQEIRLLEAVPFGTHCICMCESRGGTGGPGAPEKSHK